MRGHSWEPVQPTLGQGVDDGALGGDLPYSPNDWEADGLAQEVAQTAFSLSALSRESVETWTALFLSGT